MRGHLILFVRAPALGRGKRRLAREIGDVAALRFERLMIARLLRRLAGDSAVAATAGDHTGPGAPRGLQMASWDRGCAARSRRSRRPHAPRHGDGPARPGGADRQRHSGAFGPAYRRRIPLPRPPRSGLWASCGWRVLAGRRTAAAAIAAVVWKYPLVGSYALADTLDELPRDVSVGFVDALEDVDDRSSYRRLNPQRGF